MSIPPARGSYKARVNGNFSHQVQVEGPLNEHGDVSVDVPHEYLRDCVLLEHGRECERGSRDSWRDDCEL